MGDIGIKLSIPVVVDVITKTGHDAAKIIDVAAYCHIYGVDRGSTVIVAGNITYTIAEAYIPAKFFAADNGYGQVGI